MSANISKTLRTDPLTIAVVGGSNVLGHLTGAPWETLPPNVSYYSNKSGAFQQEVGWLNNPGICVGLIHTIVNVYGYTSTIVLVEHGVAGVSLQQLGATFAADHIANMANIGVTPSFVATYAGTVDAGVHSIAAVSRTSAQTAIERYRTKWGQAVGAILCTPHTPSAGWDADYQLVYDGIFDFAADHELAFGSAIDCSDLEIQPVNDHLTGGAGGGAHECGRRIAELIRLSGLV